MAERRPDRFRGPRHDEFWAWCGKGELRLQRCATCDRLAWPVVSACEHCGGAQLNWERMSGRGRIVSWCAFHYDYYQGMMPLPYDAILVELEEGPLFISNPLGLDVAELSAGLPAQVAFLDCEDSAGAFRLPVFQRA
jgi:uncharacterized protein